MADWKTYAKAARNTARKQAPEAKDAARRASGQASAYVRAAGRAVDEGQRPDDRRDARDPRDVRDPRDDRDPRDTQEPRAAQRPRTAPEPRDARDARTTDARTATAPRPPVDRQKLTKDAAAYYTVASRRVAKVNIVPRVMRALRDALLIGLSLFVIWGVLAAAGIPIPFTTVLIIVGLIVVVSFGTGLYAQWKRTQEARDAEQDPRDL